MENNQFSSDLGQFEEVDDDTLRDICLLRDKIVYNEEELIQLNKKNDEEEKLKKEEERLKKEEEERLKKEEEERLKKEEE